MDKYKKLKSLGDGTFGSVVKAVEIATGRVVAIKRMKKKYFKWEECITLPEIKSLIKLHHPNIVDLIEVIKQDNDLFFVFEYLDQNIFQLMKDRQRYFNEPQIRNIIYQTLQGLGYMHRQGYFHRDLKPENLLECKGTVKIADFGLAKEITARPPFTDYVSTRWYRAPEVILRAPNYNAPIDIFAIGAIMAELYKFWPLFPGNSEVDQMDKICAVLGTPNPEEWPEGYKLASQAGYKFPRYPPQSLKKLIPNASDEALELIRDMLKYNPAARPTVSQALQYPYFQCRIPIPESVKVDINALATDEKEAEPDRLEYSGGDENNDEGNNYGKRETEETSKTSISGYYMRKARYKPGINPLKLKNQQTRMLTF
eukprot:TRINITY_DN8249_c0_g1_i1.p1 TRINITY_DN8249_c0_g1~~TRINITY_DN8249_c0_g1_i1.p1  ORF type:complete len:370 (+),score=43.04 TRINITY_DN8249_c0_g1_i1:1221-2330(+)